jgi:hypothetical protein
MFYLYNLKTKTRSKKSWKTWNGAMRNSTEYDVLCDSEAGGMEWMERHPEFVEENLKRIEIDNSRHLKFYE